MSIAWFLVAVLTLFWVYIGYRIGRHVERHQKPKTPENSCNKDHSTARSL